MALSVTATATAMPVRYVPTLVEADDAQLHALAVAGGVVTGQWRQWTGEAWIKSVFFWNAGDLTLVPATHENCEAVLFGAGQTDVAYGFDYTDDLLMRFEADAMTPLASLGQVTSTAELVGSTQQGLIAGNLGGAGFVWSASDGVQHLSEGAWDLATIAAVNDTVGAVGTIDLHHSIDERAFQYLPAEGVMFDLHGDFKGRTRAVGVDGTNHILLIRQQNNGPVDFVLTDGAAGMIDSTIHSIGGAPINAHGVIGLNGHIATIWNQPFEPPQVGIVKDDGSVVVHDAPPGVIAAQLLGMSSLGTAWGAWLTELYQFQPFIVDQHTPPQLLNHAIIGYPELSFSGPTCLSDTGGIVWSFSGTTFQPSLYLTEAAAGDADGDGTVDTDDLLLILSAWGDWSSEDPCGPDLNLDHLVDVDDLLTLIEQWQ
jgi:hypothetical protein